MASNPKPETPSPAPLRGPRSEPPAGAPASDERLALILPAPGRLAGYAVLAALGIFAGAQVLPLLLAAGPLVLLAVLALGGLWLSGRLRFPANLRPDPHTLLRQSRFEQAHAQALHDGDVSPIRDHLALELPVPAADLRAPLGELYERLCQLGRSAAEAGDAAADPDFAGALREHVEQALDSLWATCRRLAAVRAQDVDIPADHPGLARVRAQVGELLGATKDVQRALAELSLARSDRRMDEAGLAMRVARRRAEALRALDDLG